MPTTSRAALRYPALTDPDNPPQDLGFLASDVDGQLYRALPCLSTARPTGVPDGFLIRETDTGLVQVYNAPGSAWVPVGGSGGGGGGGGAAAYAAVEGQWTPSSAQGIATSDTVVAFGTTEITSSIVTRSTSGAGHKFTFTEAGFYQVSVTARFSAGLAGRRFVEIRNAAQTARFVSEGFTVSDGDTATVNLSVGKRFAAAAEICVIATQSGQTTLALQHEGVSIVPGFVRLNIAKVTG